eukprot:CAMPEP_0182906162 /NCGR_PEP_ID=MMETSP0034_2-20130328/33534_1 /TAXON_ID=156128 /ORGANISM="Nephroselmis pyriformis, Strain CCMP717" /LENGTH=58 /DNA_ID=CAMNT_0025041777 /DNA_START=41 /DNA_END=214 /DNA_ORIENTATION=+
MTGSLGSTFRGGQGSARGSRVQQNPPPNRDQGGRSLAWRSSQSRPTPSAMMRSCLPSL